MFDVSSFECFLCHDNSNVLKGDNESRLQADQFTTWTLLLQSHTVVVHVCRYLSDLVWKVFLKQSSSDPSDHRTVFHLEPAQVQRGLCWFWIMLIFDLTLNL